VSWTDDDDSAELVSLFGHVTFQVAPAAIDFIDVVASAATANSTTGSASSTGQTLRGTASLLSWRYPQGVGRCARELEQGRTAVVIFRQDVSGVESFDTSGTRASRTESGLRRAIASFLERA
jgi:hypothetical protein